MPGEGVLNPNIEISFHREKKLSNMEERCVRGVRGFLPCICFAAAFVRHCSVEWHVCCSM